MQERDSNCTFSKCHDGYEAAVHVKRHGYRFCESGMIVQYS